MLHQKYLYEGKQVLELSESLINDFNKDSAPIIQNQQRHKGALFITIVGEKYYVRVNSTISYTVSLYITADLIEAFLCISGATSGLAQLSYGADKRLLKKLNKLFMNYGFVKINEIKIA